MAEFNPKTDWKFDDPVTEHELNRIERNTELAYEKAGDSTGEITQLRDDLDAHKADYIQHVNDESAHGIGDKAGLQTQSKDTIVSAINELFTSVSNGKSLLGTAITDVDSNLIVPTDPSFQELADLIKSITLNKVATGIIRPNQGVITINGLDFSPRFVCGYRFGGTDYEIFTAFTDSGVNNYWVGQQQNARQLNVTKLEDGVVVKRLSIDFLDTAQYNYIAVEWSD